MILDSGVVRLTIVAEETSINVNLEYTWNAISLRNKKRRRKI